MAIPINNSIFLYNCACCNAENITLYAKNLVYKAPIFYSTSEITLENNTELWKCNTCNSVFSQYRIPETEAQKLYSTGNSSSRWNTELSFEQEKTKQLVDTIILYITNKSKILDIGCSTGKLLDFAKSVGVENCYGTEYSQESQEICSQKYHKIIDDIPLYSNYFDVITAFDLIEHIYDIPKFFLSLFEALQTGGYLILLTGNSEAQTARLLKGNWWYYNYPEHIVFPSKQFYSTLKEFELIAYCKVHNGKSYAGSLLKQFYKFIYYIKLNKKYIGLPSFIKDHHLVVLRKIEK